MSVSACMCVCVCALCEFALCEFGGKISTGKINERNGKRLLKINSDSNELCATQFDCEVHLHMKLYFQYSTFEFNVCEWTTYKYILCIRFYLQHKNWSLFFLMNSKCSSVSNDMEISSLQFHLFSPHTLHHHFLYLLHTITHFNFYNAWCFLHYTLSTISKCYRIYISLLLPLQLNN